MGSHATVIGAVAVVSALVCLLIGFLLGKKNVKMQIEDTLDKERVSLDAREFAIREQLSEKMLEIAELRALAEERHTQRQQSKNDQMRSLESTVQEPGNMQTAPKQEEAPPVESTDVTIQKLLKSIEEKLKQPEEAVPVIAQENARLAPTSFLDAKPKAVVPETPANALDAKPKIAQGSTIPASANLPEMAPKAVSQKSTKPAPTKVPAVKAHSVSQPNASPAPPPQSPAQKDEWLEFAASLEALTRRNK
jgi:hypothetical protein